MKFVDLDEPHETITREGSNNFIKINLTKGEENDKEINFISLKKGYYLDINGKKEERIKTSLTVNFDELPLLIEALQNFKNKLESGSFS